MTEAAAPQIPNSTVAWLYKHGSELSGIRVDYRMLTEDSAETIWHVEFVNGHKQTVDMREVADLLEFYPARDVRPYRAIACLKEPLRLQCEARAKWDKANARELSELRRLQAKHGVQA